MESPQTLFDELAEDYESMRKDLDWDPFIHVKAAFDADFLKDKDILDCGCGTGEVARWIQALGGRPYGIDVSTQMCLTAAERSENIPFLPHDLADPLPFDDGDFDAVIALGCLEYIENIEDTLREFRRVMRPDGIFLGCFELCGPDCPGGKESRVVFFDEWMRYRQTPEELQKIVLSIFESADFERVPGFILEETDERTQYMRVIART